MLVSNNICSMLQRVKWWETTTLAITQEIKHSKESYNLVCETTSCILIRRIAAWIHSVESTPRLAKLSRVSKDNDKLLLILELVQPEEVLTRILNLVIRFINRRNSFKIKITFICSIRRPKTSITQMIESKPSKTLTWSIIIVTIPLGSKIHSSKSF